jgi:hypothetical protein
MHHEIVRIRLDGAGDGRARGHGNLRMRREMNPGRPKPALGFLTVVEHPQHGLFGGYLILNGTGRPLEFHCTAPIKPNRAQEILYGPTLEPYLYGEQIGRALVSRAKTQPVVICTDREPAMAVREFVDVPVALVLPGASAPPATGAAVEGDPAGESSVPRTWRLDEAHRGPRLATFALGRNQLAVRPAEDADRHAILDRLEALPETFDLAEPFGRIREAIEEARRAAQ